MRSRTTIYILLAGALALAALVGWRASERMAGEATASPGAPTPEVVALLADLAGPDWPQVRAAAFSLECLQEKAVPGLLRLAEKGGRVPLRQTGRLRYPGGPLPERVGQVVPYDLDRLSVRAGWVLERITFQPFGFREPREGEEALRGEGPVASARTDEQVAAAARRAREWWERQAPGWKRVDGLAEALTSGDEPARFQAMLFLVAGDTPCSGLDERTFRERVEPAISRLAGEAAAGRLENRELGELALSARPPEPASLTVRGVRPGMTLEAARKALRCGPPEDVTVRGAPWKKLPLKDGDLRVQVSGRGVIEKVSGDRLERDGRPLARSGQTAEELRDRLGPPWYDTNGSSRRRRSQKYRFLPDELSVRFREGKVSSFRLEPATPPERPLWEQPRALRERRRYAGAWWERGRG